MLEGVLIFPAGGLPPPPPPPPPPSAFNLFYEIFPDHTRWFSALFVLVLSTSQKKLGGIGDYSTYSTRKLSIGIVSHRLSIGRKKWPCCGLSLSSSNLKPTMSHYHSFVKIVPGCRVSVVECLLSIVCVGKTQFFNCMSVASFKYCLYIQ